MQSQARSRKSRPLEWKFNPLISFDRASLAGFLSAHPQPLSGYTLGSLVSWDPVFEYGWVFPEPETLLISCLLGPARERHLMQPLGLFPPAVQDKVFAEAESADYPLRIVGVSEGFLARHPDFARRFLIHEDETASNYVYLAEDLAQLAGRKYARKRNLISQASSLYQWTAEPIAPENTSACAAVLKRIKGEEQPEDNANLQQELAALERTLQLWRELGQKGVLLRIEGGPVAFAIYEPIHPTTVAVHFERALRSYKGLYQVINWETARLVVSSGFTFINREEDLGTPGLREAKRSYHPTRIMPAYEMVIR